MTKTKFKQVRLKKVPEDLHAKIKSLAALSKRNLEEMIIEILKTHVALKL